MSTDRSRLGAGQGGTPVRPQDLCTNNFSNEGDGPAAEGSGMQEQETVAQGGDEGMEDEERDGEDGEEARAPTRAQTPYIPTIREREDHLLTGHAVFRSWCPECVCGRGRNLGHRSRVKDESIELPVLSWDYCYLGSKALGADSEADEKAAEEQGQNPVLVMTDSRSKGIWGLMHHRKGTQFEGEGKTIGYWLRVLDGLGYKRVTFRSDNELAILAFLKNMKNAWNGEVVPEAADVGEPQSNGAAEGAVGILKGLVRTNKLSLEAQVGAPLPEDHVLITWLVLQAGTLQRRFRIGHDGRTPHERLVGRKNSTPVAEFGEKVWFIKLRSTNDRLPALGERYIDGFYLGPVDGKNEVYVTDMTGQLMKARSVKRRIPCERWTEELYRVVRTAAAREGDAGTGVRAPVQQDDQPPVAPQDLPKL